MVYDLRIFTGTSNIPLAKGIAAYLGSELADAEVSRFPDGEIKVQIQTNVRGCDVFVIQPICPPKVNEHMMELLIMLDALKRASPARITAVIPYYAYARQDRKHASRAPITAKMVQTNSTFTLTKTVDMYKVADLITAVGPDRILTLDLHAGQIQGYFNIPVDSLKSDPVIVNYLRELKLGEDMVIVAPDAGAVRRARRIAARLGTKMAMIDARNDDKSGTLRTEIIGEIDAHAVIVDDIIDTASTVTLAAKALKDKGAKVVIACATHGILSAGAIKRLRESALDQVVLTDTFPIQRLQQTDLKKAVVLSVAPLLAEAIRRIHNEESVSALYAV